MAASIYHGSSRGFVGMDKLPVRLWTVSLEGAIGAPSFYRKMMINRVETANDHFE